MSTSMQHWHHNGELAQKNQMVGFKVMLNSVVSALQLGGSFLFTASSRVIQVICVWHRFQWGLEQNGQG